MSLLIALAHCNDSFDIREILNRNGPNCEICAMGVANLGEELAGLDAAITEIPNPGEFKSKIMGFHATRCLIAIANSVEDEGFAEFLPVFQRVSMPKRVLVLLKESPNITDLIRDDIHTSFALYVKTGKPVR